MRRVLKGVFYTIFTFTTTFANVGYAENYSNFSQLEKVVRDGAVINKKITRGEALKFLDESINSLNGLIASKCRNAEQCKSAAKNAKQFFGIQHFYWPVEGYGRRDAGENGYNDRGYDWFDGNFHKAHPAYDIFVNDKNRDCIDDKTNGPIYVIALTDAIVASINDTWHPFGKEKEIRGGNYIYLYTPVPSTSLVEGLFFYYAHLGEIIVKEGEIVKAGQRIATLCRTGKNAIKKRSPTHLHFSILRYVKGKGLQAIDWLRHPFKWIEK
ncbi:MAG: M23 family metallopeptidase [Candidatus Pacearchaeota archaeon]